MSSAEECSGCICSSQKERCRLSRPASRGDGLTSSTSVVEAIKADELQACSKNSQETSSTAAGDRGEASHQQAELAERLYEHEAEGGEKCGHECNAVGSIQGKILSQMMDKMLKLKAATVELEDTIEAASQRIARDAEAVRAARQSVSQDVKAIRAASDDISSMEADVSRDLAEIQREGEQILEHKQQVNEMGKGVAASREEVTFKTAGMSWGLAEAKRQNEEVLELKQKVCPWPFGEWFWGFGVLGF